MLFLIAITIAVLTAFCLDRPLKKHPAAFYITAAVLTVASVIITQSEINIPVRSVGGQLLGLFSRGALGAAFWAVVMWAGALPNGSAPIKKLMPVRGELSITAAILTLSHIITFGVQYISRLMNGRTGSDFVITSIVSLAMTAVMLPLTVMSFKAVRRKMNARTWKNIQRFAYLFYALIFIHVMVLFVPKAQSGRDGYFLSVLMYSAVFIGYAAMRIRKYITAGKKSYQKLMPAVVTISVVCFTLIAAGSFPRRSEQGDKSAPSETNAAVFTFTPETTIPASNAVPEQQEITTAAEENAIPVTSTVNVNTDEAETTEVPSEDNAETVTQPETESAHEESPAEDANSEESEEQHTEEQQPEPETQVTYIYRNGEYEAEAEGYAGKVHVKLTIENDMITSISAWADDDDPDYFGDAVNAVIPQIGAKGSADGIDACSGATYSSNGIIEAVRNALEKAKT